MRPAPVLSCRSTSPLEELDSLLCEPSPQIGMCTLDLYSNLLRRNMDSSAYCTPAGCNPPVNEWNIQLCIDEERVKMRTDGSSPDLSSNCAIPDAKAVSRPAPSILAQRTDISRSVGRVSRNVHEGSGTT